MLLKDVVVVFIRNLSVNIKLLKRYKQVVVLAAMMEGKVVPSIMAAITIPTTLSHTTKQKLEIKTDVRCLHDAIVEVTTLSIKSNCLKISPLSFPLKFGIRFEDNFN